VKIQDLEEAIKQVYLDLAATSLEAENESVNVSKLSVMTGIHRRDVDRLFKRTDETRYGSDLLTRVIGQWQGDRRFSSKGRPRSLNVEGKDSEFVDLVNSVSKNLNPYTILAELERSGVVERIGSKIKLISRSLQISGDEIEAFSLVAKDSEDLILAVEANVKESNSLKNLHIHTEYDNISEESLATIRHWFLERGKIFHQEARDFLSSHDLDLNPDLKGEKGGYRAAICAFSFTEKPSQSKTPSGTKVENEEE